MSQTDGESSLVARCRQGDAEALAELREKCHNSLLGILLSRGADRTEAEDLLADLWADCVPGHDDRPSILEKFSGKCTLQGWLATVATNRWVDRKRKQSRFVDPSQDRSGETDFIHRIEAISYASEDTLIALLRDCLKAAFGQCSPEARVLLRLVYLHELSQREVVKMLSWNEAKVSRYLSKAMGEIEKHTLAEVKKRDPWLELTWQDFVELCETHEIGFM